VNTTKTLHNLYKNDIIVLKVMNSQDSTGGNSEQYDGIAHLCRRGDDTIDYIFT